MSLTDAIKEAYATARSDVAIIDTIEISHAVLDEHFYLVKDLQNHDLPLTLGGDPVTFEAAGIEISLPATNQEGVQDIGIGISNTDLRISEFIKRCLDYPSEPIVLTYRPYMTSDLTQPQQDPPLTLNLAGVKVDAFTVSGTATFADVMTKKFLTQNYTLNRFPAL